MRLRPADRTKLFPPPNRSFMHQRIFSNGPRSRLGLFAHVREQQPAPAAAADDDASRLTPAKTKYLRCSEDSNIQVPARRSIRSSIRFQISTRIWYQLVLGASINQSLGLFAFVGIL